MCDDVGAEFFRAQTNLLRGRMLAERAAPGDEAVARGYGSVRQRAEAALLLLDPARRALVQEPAKVSKVCM